MLMNRRGPCVMIYGRVDGKGERGKRWRKSRRSPAEVRGTNRRSNGEEEKGEMLWSINTLGRQKWIALIARDIGRGNGKVRWVGVITS